jgi:hypothetical protein
LQWSTCQLAPAKLSDRVSSTLSVTDGASATGWNDQAPRRRSALIEPISFLDIARPTSPTVSGTEDRIWARAPIATTGKRDGTRNRNSVKTL